METHGSPSTDIELHKNNDLTSWQPRQPLIVQQWDYKEIYYISRVVHMDDAVKVMREKKMSPRPITHFSAYHRNNLPSEHPCKDLKILWFAPTLEFGAPSYYGNVEFILDLSWALQKWRKSYLMEMVTGKTYTLYRILLTNTNYDELFQGSSNSNGPILRPANVTGHWQRQDTGYGYTRNYVLTNCPRFNNQGYNMQGLTVEFLIEATEDDAKEVFNKSFLTFRDHRPALCEGPTACHRFVRRKKNCPYPYSPFDAQAELFRQLHPSFATNTW
ncbi:uncharacterized protein LOC143032761 [Oratosquilla oratoria]|uniref:uncharacterized protein LOC143032761 n=1 Tax=Oratosquilla oratoria TaxID=337810 RepID=UPI003F770E98